MLEMMLPKKKKGASYASFGIFTHGTNSTGASVSTSSRYALTDGSWSAGSAMKVARNNHGWNSAPTFGIVAGNGDAALSTTEKYNYGDDTVVNGATLTTSYYAVGSGNSLVGYFTAGNGSQQAVCKYTYSNNATATVANLSNVNDSNQTGGGNASFGIHYNNAVNKITYSNDTVGQVTGVTPVTNSAHIGLSAYGLWVNGGNFGMSSYYQSATRYVYSNDTRSTQTGISVNKQGHAGANNLTTGLISSGWNASGYLTSNDTYDFAAITVAPTTALGAARRRGSGLSTSPGWY